MLKLAKNIKKRIIALMVALSCITGMSGCKDVHENKKTGDVSNEKPNVESVINTIVEEETKTEEIFGYNDEKIIEFIEVSKQQFQCQNETFNIDSLYEKIINNSNVSSKNNMFFYLNSATDEEKEEIAMFRRALRRALDICFENATNDIYEDYCKMSQIYIIRVDYGQAASFHYEKNKITVNIDLIKKDIESNKTPIDYEEYITLILEHELNHFRQFACSHSGHTAFSVKDYGFATCIESSAESQKYNVSSIAPDNVNLKYDTLRNGENLLFLIPLSYSNKDINDYYDSMFNSDLNGLYSFFELSTNEDYRTFYDILYSINTLDGRTNYYKNHSFKEVISNVGAQCKIDVLKMSLANLLKNIKEQDMSVDDAMTIYIIIKSQLVFSNPFYRETTNKYEADLVSGIKACEEKFKSFIVDYYHITIDDYDTILEYVVDERYPNILNDPLLERLPMIKNILLANPIEQEEMIGITVGNELISSVKIKY